MKSFSPTRLDFNSIKSKFKYHNLKEFAIDTISWDKRSTFYNAIDTLTYYQVNQDTSKYYYGPGEESVDLDFYYSDQKSPRDLFELTFLSQREGEYCDHIYYNIYDRTGKLRSSFRVAGRCGDGGFYESASGKFLNDSTYELLSEDNYKTEDVDGQNVITYSRELTIIRRDGSIIHSDSTLRTEVEGTGANSR